MLNEKFSYIRICIYFLALIILFDKFRVNEVAKLVEGRSAFKILTGKSTGKRPLGRPRRRWEGNIRMVFG